MKFTKICTLAKKEASDHLNDSGFLVILAAYTAIVFSSAYMYGAIKISGDIDLFKCINVKMISMFIPLIGIALGFDAVLREQRSGSMTVLLTHPVFRDYVLAGKFIGSILVLAVITIFSVFISIGALLLFYGMVFDIAELGRVIIFIILTILYASIFLILSTLLSIIVKSANDSLFCSISLWLIVCVSFGSTLKALVLMVTGDYGLDDPLLLQLLNLSPIHHYAQVIIGSLDLSFGGVNGGAAVYGIFDTRYTLVHCMKEFWSSLVYLIVTPVLFLIASFAAFLRKDITL